MNPFHCHLEIHPRHDGHEGIFLRLKPASIFGMSRALDVPMTRSQVLGLRDLFSKYLRDTDKPVIVPSPMVVASR